MESEAERKYGYTGQRVTPTDPVLHDIKPDPDEENDTNLGVSRGFADTMDSLFGGKIDGGVKFSPVKPTAENRNGTVIIPQDGQGVDLSRGYVRVGATWYRLSDESVLTDETVGLLLDEGIFTTYE